MATQKVMDCASKISIHFVTFVFFVEEIRFTGSNNAARLVKLQPRVARIDTLRVAIAEVAQKIGFHGCSREEQLVYQGIVEAGHRAAIEPERACRDDEVSALQRTVAEGVGEGGLLVLVEPAARIRRIGVQPA